MSEAQSTSALYHTLLIGISAYPPQYNSLGGCVNDIDAIEHLLLDPPGIGIPTAQIRIRRLAAPRAGMVSNSRFEAETQFPNKQNVVDALKALAGPEVKNTDRVLIYYSGHGHFEQKPNTPTHEMLALNGGNDVQFLYDVELNRYLAAIAARTTDLTVVLDCCHSGGATRGIPSGEPGGADRFLRRSDGGVFRPAPDAPNLNLADPDLPTRMQGALDPDYLAMVACQAEERAHEGAYQNGRQQGALTLSLLQLLSPMNADRRAQTRWADIFPRLLDSVGTACASLKQATQQPALIGRSERRVFGGAWRRQDPGFSISRLPDGQYFVGAGSLLGVTREAELAVYGPEPLEFPALGTNADERARIGLLQVISAERSTCIVNVMGADFDPTGARARLVKPGASLRLRVLVEAPDPSLTDILGQSNLLRLVSGDAPDVEIRVTPGRDGGWTIGNDTTTALATVPPRELLALRAALESYYHFSIVLRLARSSNDPELANVLSVRLLDCNDQDKLQRMDAMNPDLAEAPRDSDGIYNVRAGYRFCIEVKSAYRPLSKSILDQNLHVTLFDCSAGASAQYLGNTPLIWHQEEKQGDRQIVWQLDQIGTAFTATPDSGFEKGGTDRIVAVATTKAQVDFKALEVGKTVQDVVDELVGAKGVLRSAVPQTQAAPAELWTAVTVPLRIAFQ